jgi:adenosylhomocysteine nucleosidase
MTAERMGEAAQRRSVGLLTGLAAEARLARGLGALVEAGGGTEDGAARAAHRLLARGASALISFGLAGGLDPQLLPGALTVPRAVVLGSERWDTDPVLSARLGGATGHVLVGGGEVLATAAAKAAARRATGADAVDLESAALARAAARAGVPFAVLRAVCDPADRDLPRAALVALDARGRIGALRVLAAALAHPGEVPTLLALAGDAARARRALRARVRAIGALG